MMFNLFGRRIASQLHNQVVPIEAQLRGVDHTYNWMRAANHIRHVNNSAAYDGDGKTTVRILNDHESHLNLVNTYSAGGFRLHNNLFIYGSILLFPTNVFSWNVKRGRDITPESLLLFDIIVPKIKILIIGYGQHGEEYDASIPVHLKNKGISCELLTTPNAVTTYNYLVHDSVHVAGAFIPVKDDVKMAVRDSAALDQHDHLYKERYRFSEPINYENRVTPMENKQLYDKTIKKERKRKIPDMD